MAGRASGRRTRKTREGLVYGALAGGDTCFTIHRRTGAVLRDAAPALGGAWWFASALRARRRAPDAGGRA